MHSDRFTELVQALQDLTRNFELEELSVDFAAYFDDVREQDGDSWVSQEVERFSVQAKGKWDDQDHRYEL